MKLFKEFKYANNTARFGVVFYPWQKIENNIIICITVVFGYYGMSIGLEFEGKENDRSVK